MPVPSPITRMYRLEVTLEGCRKRVWRRLEVPGAVSLRLLGLQIQMAMGWDSPRNGVIHLKGEGLDLEGQAGLRRLRSLGLKPGQGFRFTHDPGQEWEHRVLVSGIVRPAAGVSYPRLLAGGGTCPSFGVTSPEEYEADRLAEHPEGDPEIAWAEGTPSSLPGEIELSRIDRRLQAIFRARPYA